VIPFNLGGLRDEMSEGKTSKVLVENESISDCGFRIADFGSQAKAKANSFLPSPSPANEAFIDRRSLDEVESEVGSLSLNFLFPLSAKKQPSRAILSMRMFFCREGVRG
jgi:hypothetical protein